MTSVEQVGYIPREKADELGLLAHGFFQPEDVVSRVRAIEAALRFIDRPAAERDPSKKQIIPYGLVLRGDDVFVVERLAGGGEARLHGKVSLGIGGHINPEPRTEVGLVLSAMRRELDEELVATGVTKLTPVGFINDDTSEVGSVHLGVVFAVRLDEGGSAQVREVDTLRGTFRRRHDLGPLQARMETWSAFVVPTLTAADWA